MMKAVITIIFLSLSTMSFSCKVRKVVERVSYIVEERATDTLLKFPANKKAGFNFEYLVYLPKGVKTGVSNYLMVETTNTGLNDTISYHEKGARYAASRSGVANYVAKKLQ